MSMTLDRFIMSAFPIEGRLEKSTCGHHFLNQYKGMFLNLDGAGSTGGRAAGDRLVSLQPVSETAAADAAAREFYRRRDEYAVERPPSLFERLDARKFEIHTFRERLKAHLQPRLGADYARYENCVEDEKILSRLSPLSVNDISRLSTIAHEVMYLADARAEIEALRQRGSKAFDKIARREASSPCETPDPECVSCVDRRVRAEVHDVFGRILKHAPEYYRAGLGRRIRSAIADVGRARDIAVGAGTISATAVREDRPGNRPLLARHIAASDNDAAGPVVAAAAPADGKSLFRRLFGCCYADAA